MPRFAPNLTARLRSTLPLLLLLLACAACCAPTAAAAATTTASPSASHALLWWEIVVLVVAVVLSGALGYLIIVDLTSGPNAKDVTPSAFYIQVATEQGILVEESGPPLDIIGDYDSSLVLNS